MSWLRTALTRLQQAFAASADSDARLHLDAHAICRTAL